MKPVYYPFCPNLQGIFLERFLLKAQQLCSPPHGSIDIEKTVQNEFIWATNETTVNPKQRLRYRAIWLLLRDLLKSGWTCRWNKGNLELALKVLPNRPVSVTAIQAAKASIRETMSASRLRKIASAREFIKKSENPPAKAQMHLPITVLIADGEALATDLYRIADLPKDEQLAELRMAVRPYLQLVREREVCPHTGHKLSEIWRYFHFLWSIPSEPTPGRTLQYLIRDAVRPYHPIIGIAAFENAPIGLKSRDDYLGWTMETLTQELDLLDEHTAIHSALSTFLTNIQLAISDISLDGLCSEEECANPTDFLIQKLFGIAAKSARQREEALKHWKEHDHPVHSDFSQKSALGKINQASENALFKRKRAEQLARLLAARQTLQRQMLKSDLARNWNSFIRSERGYSAIKTALLTQKRQHIGTSILELSVCGAIPPYNELLGGKLVALVALSPQIISDYRERYGKRPSEIATRLKKSNVIRPAELVFLSTTSLYKVGSSQYNRLVLPQGLFHSSSQRISWKQLGQTIGYGALHISQLTLKCLADVCNEDGISLINNVFGEGTSAKLRLIRQGLRKILADSQQNAADEFTKHAMSRLVYGVWLVVNGQAYLRGETNQPIYYFDQTLDPTKATDEIVEYWLRRWLLTRLRHRKTLERIAAFRPESIYLSKESVKAEKIEYKPIHLGVPIMQETTGQSELRSFLLNLYRGSSAYADHISPDFLKKIHVETRLDQAVMEAVSQGKSVVLTGNPGDGKTHLLRMLEPYLSALPTEPIVELDASTLHDAQLYAVWADAYTINQPFCIAINEAVLFKLAQKYPDFKPLQEAKHQVEHAVLYDPEVPQDFGIVVFDLSRRNVLHCDITNQVLDKFLQISQGLRCPQCPTIGCDFIRHCELLSTERFRSRLQALLDRVASRGYHATLRDLQAFVSYLLFAGRSCPELIQNSHERLYTLAQLPYRGEGKLFDEIRTTFDPVVVSHPIWDEHLINGSTNMGDWLPGTYEQDRLDVADWERFVARKRSFYFFHAYGDDLFALAGDDETHFNDLMKKNDREMLRRLIFLINRFFAASNDSDKLHVWQSHRYNQSVRRIFYSSQALPRTQFEIARPSLCQSMKQGFELTPDHVILRLRRQGVRLKIDFSLHHLLAKADRGVPIMALEGDETRRLWEFMENLFDSSNVVENEEKQITLIEPTDGEKVHLLVDMEEKRYLSIKQGEV